MENIYYWRRKSKLSVASCGSRWSDGRGKGRGQCSALPADVMVTPPRQVRAHERLEQLAVVRNAEMQELVRDDEILKSFVLLRKVGGKGDCACTRTRSPFTRHPLHANASGL